jgi:uncharacterized protein YpmB
MEETNSNETQNSKMIHVIIYLILILALGTSLFYNLTNEPKENIQDQVSAKCETLDDLPSDVKSMYVQKTELSALHTSYNDIKLKNDELEKELAWVKASDLKDKDEVKVCEEITKDANKVSDFAKCYNMDEGSYYISYQCKKDIISYVDKHKNAQYFEIIAIVDEAEFKLFKSLENNTFIYEKLSTSQNAINKLKKFSQAGLAKQRAVEASWVIKAHTKRKATTYTVHYELVSKGDKRGVIVRAYE